MISRLRGRIEALYEDSAIVDIGPFGVTVYAPAAQLAEWQVGQPVALFTYLHVREQELTLFGFATEEDLDLFQVLLGVSGVGPKLALNILSTLPPDAIRMAVANDEPGLLTRVPGIGAKSAKKILFHLKDKMGAPEFEGMGVAAITDEDAEVIEALTSLGYSIVEAQRAVQAVPNDVTGVEDRLRAALAQLMP
ncbi:MAG TPA: Holliday junction branch migration protein RuvA [Anaerolineae bacterium]|nr:Holliday junction branch migration protein RuvA [Caldilineae bacterium]HID34798.1 Holliday junction branch migration protein RuvA [Anaerolineae bacterium]